MSTSGESSSRVPLNRVEASVRRHEEDLVVVAARFGKKGREADEAEREVRDAYQYINTLLEKNPLLRYALQSLQSLCSDERVAARLLRENGDDPQRATEAWWKEHKDSEAILY